jgi:signal peptidase
MVHDSSILFPEKTARQGRGRQWGCRVFRILASLLTLFVFLFAGLFTLPKLFGIEPFVVMSGSMEPAIRTGAIAFVDTKAEDIQVGDIIAFRVSSGGEEAETITHRVVKKAKEGWVTKGDANRTEDAAAVLPDQLVGRCLFSIPKLGALLGGREKETGLLLILWVLAANLLSVAAGALFGEAEKAEKRPCSDSISQSAANQSAGRPASCRSFADPSKMTFPKEGELYEKETRCSSRSLHPGRCHGDRLHVCIPDRQAECNQYVYRGKREN